MNKILTLYDMEFKRIYKLYFGALLLFIGANISGVLLALYNVCRYTSEKVKIEISIELLKRTTAKELLLKQIIGDIFRSMNSLFMFAIIICILYSFVIWYRDFMGKNKSIYTLYMLPINKFDIYLSKLMMVVSLIFGIILTEILVWIMSSLIITNVTSVSMNEFIEVISKINAYDILSFIRFSTIEFIMVNILGVISAIMSIFTGVIIHKSFKKIGVILGIVYIIGSIVYFYSVNVLNIYYTDKILNHTLLCYFVLMLASIVISYNLLNKKIKL
ncbi:MAG: hypothetical protein ACRCXA_02990 [Peptostreptococcaceae bacterium]